MLNLVKILVIKWAWETLNKYFHLFPQPNFKLLHQAFCRKITFPGFRSRSENKFSIQFLYRPRQFVAHQSGLAAWKIWRNVNLTAPIIRDIPSMWNARWFFTVGRMFGNSSKEFSSYRLKLFKSYFGLLIEISLINKRSRITRSKQSLLRLFERLNWTHQLTTLRQIVSFLNV